MRVLSSFLSRLRSLSSPRQSERTGEAGERLAAREYERRGYAIVGRNLRFHGAKQFGELDLVCRKGDEIVFVEVKTRASVRFGGALESVGRKKVRLTLRSAKLFLAQHPEYDRFRKRIDVAAVQSSSLDSGEESVTILENAIQDE